jgi:hypothetical protein
MGVGTLRPLLLGDRLEYEISERCWFVGSKLAKILPGSIRVELIIRMRPAQFEQFDLNVLRLNES